MCKLKKHLLCAGISVLTGIAIALSAFATDYNTYETEETQEPPMTSETYDTSEPQTSEPNTYDTSEPNTSDTYDTSDTSDTSEPVTSDVPSEPEIVLGFTRTSLEINSRIRLSASVINTDEPNPVITFQSSNTNVVIVDNAGNISAVGEGSAYVTAAWGGYFASAYITVYRPAAVPEFLVLTKSNFELKIDATAQIEAKLLPENVSQGYTIYYESDNPEVASVTENGLITAHSAGTAKITVSGADLTQTVNVTVSTDIAYNHVRLDGYLYNNEGNPMVGSSVLIDGLTAVTDTRGYFFFDEVEERELTLRISGDDKAVCTIAPSGDTTVFLLYKKGAPLTRLSSYSELAGRLPINKVTFTTGTSIMLTEGETIELQYQYAPKDATVTEIKYTCSNEIIALVGQIDGVVTAKAPGEADITVTLNGGQAETVCHIVVNQRESTAYSPLIAIIETLVFGGIAAAVILIYRNYRKKLTKELDKYDEEDDI